MRKIIAVITVALLIIVVVFAISNSRVNEISWKRFKPFTGSVYIKDIKNNKLELEGDLPKIETTAAFYPLASGIVQNMYDKDSFNDDLLKCVSQEQAYTDFLNGSTDMIITTKPNEYYKKLIQHSSEKIAKIVIYKEPIVIFVNQKNSVRDLSLRDLTRMYYNNKLVWKSFGGNQNIIKTYQLTPDNESQLCINSIINNNEENDYHITINDKMSKIIDKVGKDKNGIGYSFNQYYTRMIKNNKTRTITIDGKEPTDKDYPLLTDVYIYYNASSTNKNVKFIVNYLQSSGGRSLIKDLL